MPEHRIRVTISEYGYDPENGERLLDGFIEAHPEVGPSISQNAVKGTLSATFSLEAEDASEAFDLARPIFAEGVAAAGLERTRVVNVEVSLVPASEYDDVGRPEAVQA